MRNRYKVNSPWRQTDVVGRFRIEVADALDKQTGHVYQGGAYRVVIHATGKPAKVGKGGTVPFYGEMAWADAQRLAGDLHWALRFEDDL